MVQRHCMQGFRKRKAYKKQKGGTLCCFVSICLSILSFFKYTLTVFFNIAYHSPERASRPAEVNM